MNGQDREQRNRINPGLAPNANSAKTQGQRQKNAFTNKKVSFDKKDDDSQGGSIELGNSKENLAKKMPQVSTKLNRVVHEQHTAANAGEADAKEATSGSTQMPISSRRAVGVAAHQNMDGPQQQAAPAKKGVQFNTKNSNSVSPQKQQKFVKSIGSASPSPRRSQSYDEETDFGNTNRQLWKAKYDPNQMYGMEKNLQMTKPLYEHLREIKRWRDNDTKGNRKNYYVKEVMNKNAAIMTIVKQTRLEQAQNYTDGHKCLNFRKKIMKFRIIVSETAIKITSNKLFEGFIILVIGLNCITLAMADSTKEQTPIENSIDMTFNIIYTIEMVLRIFSMGFFWNKGSYLRNYWCMLDFICVSTSYLELISPGGNSSVSGLRAFRVLRPLRFINNIAGLKVIVMSVMAAIPLLKDTIIILLFFFLIFAIGGLNLFSGQLMKRCIEKTTGGPLFVDGNDVLCNKDDESSCPEGFFCGKRTLNPNEDVTNFDNIFWAMLNVFIALTLEGWSEIMVFYFTVYTPYVFFFFMPMVFIGAFFLLNLLLAVINSSYSEAQTKIKAAKEKLRLEQEALTMSAGTSKKDDDKDDDQDDEDAAKKSKNISVHAFFVAKRAAFKLKAYWQRHKQIKAHEEAENKSKALEEKRLQKENDAKEQLRHQKNLMNQQLRRKSVILSQDSPDSAKRFDLQKTLTRKIEKPTDSKDFVVGQDEQIDYEELQNAMIEKLSALDSKKDQNKTISEEDEIQSQRSSVQEFFEKTAQALQQNTTSPKDQGGNQTMRIGSTFDPVMAFNDIRISGGKQNLLFNKNLQGTIRPKNEIYKNNFAKTGKPVEGDNNNSEDDRQHDWILSELDFEKVIVQRGQDKKNESLLNPTNLASDLYEVDHPLDLSFIRDKNYGKRQAGYASENEKGYKDKEKGSVEESFSILSSNDESLNAKLNDKTNKISGAKTAKNKRESKQQKSKEVKSRIKRMLTTDLKDKTGLNDSQSTFLGKSSFKQQIDLFSNLMLEDGKNSLKMPNMKTIATKYDSKATDGNAFDSKEKKRNVESVLSKHTMNKKLKINMYREVDRDFFCKEKPLNPRVFINTEVQKVMINPGIPYISTSVNEIFEIRNQENQKQYLNKINPFIAPPKDEIDVGAYQGKEEEHFMTANFKPHQLKTIYQVSQVDEIEFDDDDEDALMMMQQPYETVMQTCFSDLLDHLPTKFLARRSDIIVSSTLSITLTPQVEKEYEPIKFALADDKAVWDYVMLRQEYRANFVTSNKLPSKIKYFYAGMTDSLVDASSDEESSEDLSNIGSFFDEEQNANSDRASSISGKAIRLPPTLLSEPLKPYQILGLNRKEKRLYTLQRNKYEQVKKMIAKKKDHPKDTTFTLEQARELIKGNYHEDEEEEEQELAIVNDDGEGKVNLNRAMLVGKNDVQHEINLDAFDIAINRAIQNIADSSVAKDPRLQGNHVPEDIKKAFNLPRAMTNYDIDYEQVRKVDSQFQRRVITWSGQDVLYLGLNMEKSKMVVNHFNIIRVWPKGFHNAIKKFRCLLKYIIRLSIFDNALTAIVLANTVGMAMDSYSITPETQSNIEFMNEIFTWIFIVEMTMRILARGPKKYVSETMNLLDGGVVCLSIIEMIMASLGGGGGANSLQTFRTVRVFRTFRVLRVTRVLRALRSMAMVMGVIMRSFMDFILITILMFVFIFIYTLLGRQIFQGSYDFGPDVELPRANYETFTIAFVTVFQVLTMENWQQVIYASIASAKNSMVTKTISAIYYISWIFIGNFILLNLFLAILIDAFGDENADMEDTPEMEAAALLAIKTREKRIREEKEKRMRKLGTSKVEIKRIMTQKLLRAPTTTKAKPVASFTGQKVLRESDLNNIEDMEAEDIRKMMIEHGILKANKSDNIDKKLVDSSIEAENSVYLFGRNTCFRRNCHFIQKHKYFENFIMLLIGLSSAKLALESYIVDLPEDAIEQRISNELDFIFNYFFIIEMVLKMVALGFVMDGGCYLSDSWNKLDFFIVSTSILDMCLVNTDIPALKVLRMLRMIRPLRVVSHNPQLKMIVSALFESLGSIVNVSVIVMIVWLMFAIYGMNTYMGMFYKCTIDPYKYGTKWLCEDAGGKWKNWDQNFDNIGSAMVTLFALASLEGWPDTMIVAVDSTKRDNGPMFENSPANSAFFIIFILIGSFFFLNFFIGVLFLKYEEAQKKEEAGFTKKQLFWQEISEMVIKAQVPHELRYKPATRGPRYSVWMLINSNPFDIGIMLCIVLNMVQMALDHEGLSPGMSQLLKVTNYFFTAVFFIEACLKLFVYRGAYFKTAWNKFDFFVVASSLIDLGLEWTTPEPVSGQETGGGNAILSVGPQLARVLRVLRVSRVLRLAGKYKGLQSLLKTVVMSADSLFNVFLLLMLIFFIMAVLGNTLFKEVSSGVIIGEWKNFKNFHMSFMLLFIMATGEDWNVIMFDCWRGNPDCEPGEWCGSSFAPVYFLMFTLIVGNVMLNLFILVIIQQFSKYYLEKDNPLARFEEDFEDIKTAWKIFTDRYHAIKIKPKYVPAFFRKLPQRIQQKIGIEENAKEEDLHRVVLKMGINVDDGFIYLNEMVYRIMRAQFVVFNHMTFNKVMTVNELVIQYRISEITLKEKLNGKGKKKSDMENFFFTQLSSQPMNLFLTKLFYKTSFRTWKGYMENHLRQLKHERTEEEIRKHNERLGKTYVPKAFPKQEIQIVDIEIERESEMSLSMSDSEIVEDNKSRKTGGSLRAFSEFTKTEKNTDSHQQNFRLKAKMRMLNKKESPALDIKKTGIEEKLSSRKSKAAAAKADANFFSFVNPNSQASVNAALEDKINAHEKQQQRPKCLKSRHLQGLKCQSRRRTEQRGLFKLKCRSQMQASDPQTAKLVNSQNIPSSRNNP